MFLASSGLIMAGWHSAPAAKRGLLLLHVKETIFPPQQKPTTPQVLMEGYLAENSLIKVGTFSAAFGGAPVVWKKFPRAFPFSSLSGGYLHIISFRSGPRRGAIKLREDVPGNVSWLAIKEIRHEDLVLMILVGGRENISSLKRLREVSENIKDVEKTL